MTIDELDTVGHNNPVMYRGQVVTYEYLTMRFVLGGTRKQPMKASVILPSGRAITVNLKSLSPISQTSTESP